MSATPHIFVYKWKDSDDEVARIVAITRREADFKLGLKRSHASVKDALETGLIFMSGTKNVAKKKSTVKPAIDQHKVNAGNQCPNCGSTGTRRGMQPNTFQCKACGWSWEPDVEEAINQLIKNWDDKTGKPMLKAWQKAINGLVPLSKEVMESTEAHQLYHGTSIDGYETN